MTGHGGCGRSRRCTGRGSDDDLAGKGHNVPDSFLADKAKFIRLETLRLTRIAGAGYYSSTFSAAEMLATLYYAHLRIDPANPRSASPSAT